MWFKILDVDVKINYKSCYMRHITPPLKMKYLLRKTCSFVVKGNISNLCR